MSRTRLKDSIIMGFALFAIFFGAGNLIFPPYIGWMAGSYWIIGFLCFIFFDMGLSMLGLMAVAKTGRGAEGVTERLGGKASFVLLTLNCLCLGPLIAIPRTAATAYEIGIAPNLSNSNSWIFTFIFFMVAVALSLKKSKIIDIIGKVIAPILFLILMIVIIKGIISPIGSITSGSSYGSATSEGMALGYQTMDMLAVLIIAMPLLSSLSDKGYRDKNSQYKILSMSGIVAAMLLFAVYGGLAYLGATATNILSGSYTQSGLITAIMYKLMGENGMLLLGILVTIACLTPAISLLTSVSEYFSKLTNIEYKYFVFGFAGFSWIVSNFGIAKIISLAAPILGLIYPVVIVLFALTLVSDKLPKGDRVYRFAAAGALVSTVIMMIETYTGNSMITSILPLSDIGLGWFIPALIGGIIGSSAIAKPGIARQRI